MQNSRLKGIQALRILIKDSLPGNRVVVVVGGVGVGGPGSWWAVGCGLWVVGVRVDANILIAACMRTLNNVNQQYWRC